MKTVSKKWIPVLLVVGALSLAPCAKAAYVIDVTQVGSNVVATGSGTLDLTDLTFQSTAGGLGVANMDPSLGYLILGSGGFFLYSGFSGPSTIGPGGLADGSSTSGDDVGMAVILGEIGVPVSYVSGSALSSVGTWDSQTLSSLGLTVGTYTWTWGTGNDADSFAIDVEATSSTPEPAPFWPFGAGAALLGLLRLVKRQDPSPTA